MFFFSGFVFGLPDCKEEEEEEEKESAVVVVKEMARARMFMTTLHSPLPPSLSFCPPLLVIPPLTHVPCSNAVERMNDSCVLL